jgi:sec-independent protein translocase protein TatB
VFEVGWTELLLIGIVALIVIGPKDLPHMFRALGRFTAKARAMAREFSRAMEQAADESGLKDAARDVRNAANMPRSGMDAVKEAARKFEAWDPLKGTKPAAPPPNVAIGPKPAAPVAEAAAKPMGPATQALADAQAARRAEAEAQAAALRAAREGEGTPETKA